jgi:hypothetical protein
METGGGNLVMHLGRTVCGMSIRDLSRGVEIEYVSAAAALRRFSERAKKDRALAKLIQQATAQLHNATPPARPGPVNRQRICQLLTI